MNLSTAYVREHGGMDAFQGLCLLVAVRVAEQHGGQVAVVRCQDGSRLFPAQLDYGVDWRYHAVPVVDGLAHDAWTSGDAMPLHGWLAHQFPSHDLVVSTLSVGELRASAQAALTLFSNDWRSVAELRSRVDVWSELVRTSMNLLLVEEKVEAKYVDFNMFVRRSDVSSVQGQGAAATAAA